MVRICTLVLACAAFNMVGIYIGWAMNSHDLKASNTKQLTRGTRECGKVLYMKSNNEQYSTLIGSADIDTYMYIYI